jgi:MotA/TolQ/ExbB proton channel family protein
MFEALWRSVWADNTLPGKTIVSVILVLLVWALAAGSRHLKRYRSERANLDRIVRRLQESTVPLPPPAENGEPVAAPAQGEEASAGPRHISPADLSTLRKELDPGSLIANRLEAIEKLRTRQVKVNPSTLQQLSLAHDESRPGMAVPGAVAGMATMLGLLGTFIGLAVMVQQVQFVLPKNSGAVTIDSWTQSIENIAQVLGGIKTAFSASLVGIVCAILASLLNFRLRTVQALFFERLERFTIEDLLPAAVPAVEDESLLDRVSLQLETSFSRLEGIFQLNQEALKDITAAQRAFVDIVGEVRQITRSEASRNLEGVLEQLSQTNRSVLSVVDQLPKIATAVESGQRRLLERLGSFLSAPAPPITMGAGTGSSSRPSMATVVVVIVTALVVAFLLLKNLSS